MAGSIQDKIWYYKGWLREVGPLTPNDLLKAAVDGKVKLDTLVRKGMDPWLPASELKGFFEWYYKQKNKEVGPLLSAQLLDAAVDGKVKLDTLVRKGTGPWLPASQLEGFFKRVEQMQARRREQAYRASMAAIRRGQAQAEQSYYSENESYSGSDSLNYEASSEDFNLDFTDTGSSEEDSSSGFGEQTKWR